MSHADEVARLRELRIAILVVSVLVLLLVVFVALTGGELPSVTRRPIAEVRTTFADEPVGFVLRAVPLWFGAIIVTLIGHAIVRAIVPRTRR